MMSMVSGDIARHVPVMRAEMLEALKPRDGEIHIDCTFGAGGYSRAILEVAHTRVFAIDRDPTAIEAGAALVAAFPGRLTLLEGRFADMEALLSGFGIDRVDGVVLDIGVSSMQLDEAQRGFSFAKDGPLDMRMSREGPSAADIVNKAPYAQLTRIIGVLGEEHHARAIARAIEREREKSPILTTLALAEIVSKATGGPKGRIHPATRTFQALRIHVNHELEELAEGLAAAERLLKPGGRLAVITFHSLEDRIAKRFLAERAGQTGGPSRHAPETSGPRPSFTLLFKGHHEAGEAEIVQNPRARSAKLRAAIRTAAPALPLDEAALGVKRIAEERR
ncbi:MAG: 16S rRNA (cytosine(1402)-N(4))-methyltransferase RsmH [Hyphomicrobiales bacterium]